MNYRDTLTQFARDNWEDTLRIDAEMGYELREFVPVPIEVDGTQAEAEPACFKGDDIRCPRELSRTIHQQSI